MKLLRKAKSFPNNKLLTVRLIWTVMLALSNIEKWQLTKSFEQVRITDLAEEVFFLKPYIV